MKQIFVLLVLSSVVLACGAKEVVSDTRVAYAPPRAADCELEFTEVDMTDVSFHDSWQLLGYISFGDSGKQDPRAEENQALARPMACDMGGTAMGVAGTSTSSNFAGDSSVITYLVMRPKP